MWDLQLLISAYVSENVKIPKSSTPALLKQSARWQVSKEFYQTESNYVDILATVLQVCVLCVCVLHVLFLLLTHTARKVAIHSSWLWPYQTESVTLTSRGENELELDTNAMDIWALLRTPTCGAHTNTHTLTSVSACIVNATSYACNRSPANFTEQWSQIIRQYWIAWPFCCGPLDLH